MAIFIVDEFMFNAVFGREKVYVRDGLKMFYSLNDAIVDSRGMWLTENDKLALEPLPNSHMIREYRDENNSVRREVTEFS